MEVTPAGEAAPAGGIRRLGLITIDQGISSSSNILIAFLAARVLGADTFGLFTIVFLIYVTSQGISRALLGEPLLVRPEESEERPGEAIGSALTLGLAAGAVAAVGGVIAMTWSHDLGVGFLVLGACTPLLTVQDLGRYLGFATHRPARSLTLDLVWLGLLIVAVVAVSASGADTLGWFLAAWGGTGSLAGILTILQHRGHRVALGVAWLRETWSYSWRYALSFASRQGAVLVGSSIFAALLGAAALGGVNGATILFGPLVQLQTAAIAAGVAEVSRLRPGSPEVRRHIWRSTAFTTGAAVLNLALVLLVPDRFGELLLGDSWRITRGLLWPAGTQFVLVGLISGVRSTLLGVKALATTVRVDIAGSVLTFAFSVGGALVLDIRGAFWCLAAAQGVVAVLWWAAFLKDGRGHETEGEQWTSPA